MQNDTLLGNITLKHRFRRYPRLRFISRIYLFMKALCMIIALGIIPAQRMATRPIAVAGNWKYDEATI